MSYTLRRLLWQYGPTFRWRTFRLYGEPPNGRWQPLRVTQVVGGRTWSLSLMRTGPVQEPSQGGGEPRA